MIALSFNALIRSVLRNSTNTSSAWPEMSPFQCANSRSVLRNKENWQEDPVASYCFNALIRALYYGTTMSLLLQALLSVSMR